MTDDGWFELLRPVPDLGGVDFWARPFEAANGAKSAEEMRERIARYRQLARAGRGARGDFARWQA